MSGPAPRFTDEQLVKMCMKEQLAAPLMSEKAIMGKIGVGKEYLADRSQKSEKLRDLREKLSAIREWAWIQFGIDQIPRGKDFNSIAYIWMTRNILGWRDSREETKDKPSESGPPVVLTPDILKELIKSARGDK